MMMRPKLNVALPVLALFGLLTLSGPLFADGPGDNQSEHVRSIPPPGIDIPDDMRALLHAGLENLNMRIAALRNRNEPKINARLADVEIFARAVDQALRYGEFFNERDFAAAGELLHEGQIRADSLDQGVAPWTRQTGLVVRGYRSKLDNTVQPYGLLIPDDYAFDSTAAVRCDVWLHGRFENVVELQFIQQRMKSRGEIAPAGTIVLHPFGRFSNAFKFAGEVDVWEALDDVRANYHVDARRIGMRGFSMGGAGCWQFTVHDPDRFFASNPGAGFTETPQFLRVFQNERVSPPAWEQTLWNWYDCPGWVGNLRMIPTVAYSGEIDRQKQAADVMAEACREEGIELTHIIGPQTAHAIHPDSKIEIERRLDLIDHAPRATPRHVTFSTFTLRYDRCGWIQIRGLDQHWSPARVDADLSPEGELRAALRNVSDVEFHFEPGQFPADCAPVHNLAVTWTSEVGEGLQSFTDLPPLQTDRSWSVSLHRDGASWKLGPRDDHGLRKLHGLQGPIDDAFLGPFLFVRSTGDFANAAVKDWTEHELEHAVTHWRQQMRGDAPVKNDSEVTAEDIATRNLVLWGDPASNRVLGRILDRLPIGWSARTVTIGDQQFDADAHVPVLIFPNPENPQRYVVLNSSFTYREYDYLNNARQTPKLPDWAIIDVRTPAGSRWPGRVATAGFFDETWKLAE